MARRRRLVPQVEPQYWTVKTAEIYSDRSAWSWRRDAYAGRVASVKLRGQLLIPVAEIKRVIAEGTRPRIVNPSKDSAPPQDAEESAPHETPEPPEADKAAVSPAPGRLYQTRKPAPAKTAG